MKIVFLDSSSLGKKDLSRFEKLGTFLEYPTTSKEELKDRIEDADIIITNKVLLGKSELLMAKQLKLVCIAATGFNNIDLFAAKELGIKVINVKDYSTESVAQITLTYILNLSSSLIEYNNLSKSGKWSESPIFTRLDFPFSNLKGKKLGIIGYGAIGRRVAELAQVFGMKTLISERPRTDNKTPNRIEFDTVVSESDFISIHAPLNKNTENLFDLNTLKKMKNTAFLINTARGPIINEDDLFIALKEGVIKGAAIDVMKSEPPKAENPLFSLPNIIITPHMAWASDESISTLLDGIEYNINNFFEGTLTEL